MPTHAAGDLILVWTFRDGSTTAPTVPAGFTFVSNPVGTTCNGQLAMKRATTNAHTTGTWTGATGISIAVLRGAAGLGAPETETSGSGTTLTYPALTLQNTAGNAWAFRFAGARAATNLTTNSPSTVPNTAVTGVATECRILSSNGGISTSPTAGTQTVTGSSGWVTSTIEVLAEGDALPAFTDTFSAALDSRWKAIVNGSGSITTTGGTLNFTCPAFNFVEVQTVRTWEVGDLTGKAFSAQVVTGSSTATRTLGPVSLNGQAVFDGYAVTISGTTAQAQYYVGGTATNVGSTRTHTANDYYRISESGGTVLFETSTNGTTWSSWTSTPSTNSRLFLQPFVNSNFTANATDVYDNVTWGTVAGPANTGAFFAMF